MRNLFLTGCLILCQLAAIAQQAAYVKGVVTNETGQRVKNVNVALSGTSLNTHTTEDGTYQLEVPAGALTLHFSHAAYISRTVNLRLEPGETRQVNMNLSFLLLDTLVIRNERPQFIDELSKIDYKAIPTFSGNIEDLIKTAGLGVSGRNEMSAAYSVRGGSFDENLIYVNDIEIYRPFLVRSGQQEGLSFINSDMVDNISFSSGGFEARYGDKLSSVLDIRYKKPTSFGGSASASLMGGTVHLEGISKNSRFTHLTGIRYRANSYILNALPTQGDYRPTFADMQSLLTYAVNEKWDFSLLGYYSNNKYRFVPQTRETEFGTVNEALRLTVYFDGQEITQFENYMGALTATHRVNERTELKFITSAFRSIETEAFDVQGQYRLDELERDLASENFGEVLFTRGVGTFLDHARNRLDAWVYNVAHQGKTTYGNSQLLWGLKVQGEQIKDRLSEWQMLDSAGFSIPQHPKDEIVLNQLIKARIQMGSNRVTGYAQHNWFIPRTDTIRMADTLFTSSSSWNIHAGIRGNYWDFNNQIVVSPRAGINYIPSWFRWKNGKIARINTILRFSTGLYYQPPFYRELRDFEGNINYDIRAQRAIHFVVGGDYFFDMWGRTFKFTSEIYYKHLDFLIPYQVDNVRLRYFARNNSKGYAAGWDFKINGEFIKGIESWATLSLLRTYEDIKDDSYKIYYNSDGERIIPGYTVNNTVADSTTVYPGYIPRPTDQRVTFNLFFQDEMPGFPSFKVHLNLVFGSRVPYGPPGTDRFRDTLRTPPYRRVDIGFSKQFLTNRDKIRPGSLGSHIKDLWLSLEVFNLLGIDNTISYQWLQDVTGRRYAIPNYLTARRLNLKLVMKF